MIKRKQNGGTLIEVLVAMVILAIALLGMAGLTSASMKYNQMSRARATGLSLVTDYAERARSNLFGFANYAYTAAYTAGTREAATSDPTDAPDACSVDTSNPSSIVNTCAASIAAYDQAQWLTNVANRLPGGTAYIETSLTNAPPGVAGLPPTRVLDIWLIWTEIDQLKGFKQSQTCPSGANISEKDDGSGELAVSCMYFRITL
ncbi:type IV pilus modification protein PilV [Ottowia thiooxydans]|uniref:type IV pilus modification protein PilV n=1 Tax=Ottowia thiooxydans TaxID=219182 RepID=UPI0003FF0ED5|nr:type IV pilus modification protein PilV [Ottowia thiooxydans]